MRHFFSELSCDMAGVPSYLFYSLGVIFYGLFNFVQFILILMRILRWFYYLDDQQQTPDSYLLLHCYFLFFVHSVVVNG